MAQLGGGWLISEAFVAEVQFLDVKMSAMLLERLQNMWIRLRHTGFRSREGLMLAIGHGRRAVRSSVGDSEVASAFGGLFFASLCHGVRDG
jgi:hypothetical protein